MKNREYYVIKFKNPPVQALNFSCTCVPKIWIKIPYDEVLPECQTVVVETKYPIKPSSKVRRLVINYKECLDEEYYDAYLVFKTNTYEKAMQHIKSRESNEPHREQNNRLTPIPSTSTTQDQDYTPPAKKPKTSKPPSKKLSSPKKPNLRDAVLENTMLIKTVAADLQILKQEFTAKLCYLISIIDKLDESQSGTVQPNSPQIDRDAVMSGDATENDGNESEIGHESTTEVNNATGIDVSIATTSITTTPTAEAMEQQDKEEEDKEEADKEEEDKEENKEEEDKEETRNRTEVNNLTEDLETEDDDNDTLDVVYVNTIRPSASAATREELTAERRGTKRGLGHTSGYYYNNDHSESGTTLNGGTGSLTSLNSLFNLIRNTYSRSNTQ